MNRFLNSLCLIVVLISASLFASLDSYSQCSALPFINSVNVNVAPPSGCSQVTSILTYQISFASPTSPTDDIKVYFVWGDGTPDEFTTVANGQLSYNVPKSHAYPINSDCEYEGFATILVNGNLCNTTIFKFLVSSYRTDDFNAGLVQLTNPTSTTRIYDVCEGLPILDTFAFFNDITNFNCDANYVPTLKGTVVARPNEFRRWQQIVYNTKSTAVNRIPNVKVGSVLGVGGTLVTGPGGADVIANFQDPRGVLNMAPNVVFNDPRRRPTLGMSAPGGFGPGFPVAGDIFEVTLRYWNRCNPYSNNPLNTNVPNNGDFINGDNPPIEATALIRIVSAPTPPNASPVSVCKTAGNGSYLLTATPTGSPTPPLTYRWYLDAGLTTLLQSTQSFNPVTQGPIANRIVPASVVGSQTFTRYVTVTQSGSNTCTSPPRAVTIRIDDTNTPGTISHPLGLTPITICSGTDPASFIDVSSGTGGGPTAATYQWELSTTSAVSGFSDITGATSLIYNPPAISTRSFFRRRLNSGNCPNVFSNVIEFLVDTPVTGGSIDGDQTICASPGDPTILNNVSAPTATGGSNTGSYTFVWQQSAAFGGPFTDIGSTNSLFYDPPAGFTSDTYFRRRVTSGVCAPLNVAFSNVVLVQIDQVVNAGTTSGDQTICSGQTPLTLLSTSPPSGGDGASYTILWEESSTSGSGFGPATGINNGLTYSPDRKSVV